jgi:hypothetical protein
VHQTFSISMSEKVSPSAENFAIIAVHRMDCLRKFGKQIR